MVPIGIHPYPYSRRGRPAHRFCPVDPASRTCQGAYGWAMGRRARSHVAVRNVDDTLKWVVVIYRVLACAWALVLIGVLLSDSDSAGDRPVVYAGAALAVVWTLVTVWIARHGDLLGKLWFVISDGLVILLLSAGGAIAGAEDFFSGGYPGSWLFVVAFAANLRWTMVASVVLVAEHAYLHVVMELSEARTAGALQFVVLGLVVGWAFDSLRTHDALRVDAERALADERAATALYQDRAAIAQRLHDSVLQTLHVIRTQAEDPQQVRYAARRQERELRHTIDELSSRHVNSYRAALQAIGAEVEDLFPSVEIDVLVRGDTEVEGAVVVGLAVAREAMVNAAKHSGQDRIDVYGEVADQLVRARVRDRGPGMDAATIERLIWGSERSMGNRLARVGGTVSIASGSGGTEVTVEVPAP